MSKKVEHSEPAKSRHYERPLSRETVDALRARLVGRRREILRGLASVEGDLEELETTREIETEEEAQRVGSIELLERLEEREAREYEAIQRALAKIPAHAFGLCERCTFPIATERLDADPTARFCGECEEEAELAAAASAGEPGDAVGTPKRRVPPELADLDDAEIAEAVRERLRSEEDPDLGRVRVACRNGKIRLTGELPSESQRQVLVQLLVDEIGLEVDDRVRVTPLEPYDDPRRPPAGPETDEERIVQGRAMDPVRPEPRKPPEDEGDPPRDAPTSPVPEIE